MINDRWKNNRGSVSDTRDDAVLFATPPSNRVKQSISPSSQSCSACMASLLSLMGRYLLTDLPKLTGGFLTLFITLVAAPYSNSADTFLILTFILAVGDGLVQV
jgi:hypothetical protein